MEALAPLIIQLISGAVGGNIVGSALKNLSLGTAGNSVAGAVGGGVLGYVLDAFVGGGGMNIGAILGDVVGGGAGGAVLTAIIGAIRQAMAKA